MLPNKAIDLLIALIAESESRLLYAINQANAVRSSFMTNTYFRTVPFACPTHRKFMCTTFSDFLGESRLIVVFAHVLPHLWYYIKCIRLKALRHRDVGFPSQTSRLRYYWCFYIQHDHHCHNLPILRSSILIYAPVLEVKRNCNGIVLLPSFSQRLLAYFVHVARLLFLSVRSPPVFSIQKQPIGIIEQCPDMLPSVSGFLLNTS